MDFKSLPTLPLKTGKGHISFSEAKDWIDCPYRHKLKHVDKVDLFVENVYTNFGKAVHASCEDYLKTRKMKYEIALDDIRDAWEKYKLPDVGLWMKKALKNLQAVPGWLDTRFPGWECVEAEEALMEPIPGNHENVRFKGFIDAIIKHNNVYYLLDWKSSNKGWNNYKKNDELTRMQLVLYNFFWSRKHQIAPEQIKCGFVILNGDLSSPERIDFFTFDIDEKVKKRSLTVLNDMISNVKAGMVIKQLKSEDVRMQGSCRFCEYNSTKWCP